MRVRASAPGKLVVLGEYAVLEGAQALVMAAARRCQVEIAAAETDRSRLEIRAPNRQIHEFEPAEPSGIELIDIVRDGIAAERFTRPINAALDSTAFFAAEQRKLGLGSSAAVLTAFAGALQVYDSREISGLTLERLIELHRQLQGGRGSGIDVAAALHGGLNTFQRNASGQLQIGSVRLPNSVRFAGIFAGKSASTSDFVERFRNWRQAEPKRSVALLDKLASVSAAGCVAVRSGDADEFLAAIAEYGNLLDALGSALQRDVLTKEHRQIAALADKSAVTYKTSGAGGGDLGIAFSQDVAALAALQAAVAAEGFLWVDLEIDPHGLLVEELTE